MLIVLRENLALQDINTTRKNSKQSGIVAIDSCFALSGARQYGVTTRKLWCKISAHSDLSSDLEPSTPTESCHTTCLLGGKSPSVKLMSRRENEKLAKHGQNLCLQSRSVFSSFGVVLTSCRVNFHVVLSALQYSACRI